MKLTGMEDAKVGDRLTFAYYGGSNYGGVRTVDVEEMEDDRMKGTDVDKQQKRQYIFDVCRGIVVERRKATEVISFIQARERLCERIETMEGEELAGYLGGVFDSQSGELTLEKELVEPHFIFPFHDEHACCIVNNEEEKLTMEMANKTVCMDGLPITPIELVQQLSSHLGLTDE